MLLLFLLIFIIFSIPAVQTGVARKLTKDLKTRTGVDITVDRVGISYLGEAELKGILIKDHHGDTLIYAKELNTSLLSLKGAYNNKPALGDVYADGLLFNMKRYKDEETDNFSIFIDKLSSKESTSTKPFKLTSKNIIFTNSHYEYIDENLETPQVVLIDDLAINASDLLVLGKEVSVDVERLAGKEGRGITINSLATEFYYSPQRMSLKNLSLETPHSNLKGEINFLYELEDFQDFLNKVRVEANFEDSSLSTTDLKGFYKEFGTGESINFTTKLTGTLNDFDLMNVRLRGMNRSVIYGDIRIEESFAKDKNNFKLTGNLSNLTTNYYDLVNLLPNILRESLPKNLISFGNVKFTGQTSVTQKRLTVDGALNSQLGDLLADIEINEINNIQDATYTGKLAATEFNLGQFLDRNSLGITTFNLNVDGSGLLAETLNTNIKGEIQSLEYNDYTYQGITASGRLTYPIFNGYLNSKDVNANLDFEGFVDVSEEKSDFDFTARIKRLNLVALNLNLRDSISIFSGDLIMDITGSNIDNAEGAVVIQNAVYENEQDQYEFADLSIISSYQGNVHTLEISSPDVIDGKLTGVYQIRELPALFENAVGSLYTNYRPNTTTENQYLQFDFDIYSKIVEAFLPNVEIAANTFIRGSVESDVSEFNLSFKSPSLTIEDNTFDGVNVQVDNTNPLFNTFIDVKKLENSIYNISNFNLINVTLRDTLFVQAEFNGGKEDRDDYDITFYHTIDSTSRSVIGLRKSTVNFKNNTWYINEEKNPEQNKILFDRKLTKLKIDSILISHENEKIFLNGSMKDANNKDFELTFDQVDLKKITPSIDSLALDGLVNGRLNIIQQEGVYTPTANLTIEDVKINDFQYGKLALDIAGNSDLTKFDVDAILREEKINALSANGEIMIEGDDAIFDLDASLNKLDLSAFSALGGDVLTDIRGLVSGRAKITGNAKSPSMTGQLLINNGGLKIPYLNVDLDFEQRARVDLTNQQFYFNNINITDVKYKTRGVLDGTITHTNFSNWQLDLDLDTDRLVVLDTEYNPGELYYGTAFIAGEANIVGPTDNLTINVIAETEPGTVFKIPLDDTASFGDNSFIYFLSPEEKELRAITGEVQFEDLKGLDLNFDLDIDDDAEVEVVVDVESGSTLKGRGAGTLLIEISTTGKFNMWGDFIVLDGTYNFKYGQLVNKVFQVENGGTINWDGSPLRADLNVSAIYKEQVNPALLLENPSFNRQIPVDVIINLQGDLIQPNINFDLRYPNLSSVVQSELDYRINDNETKEIQALSIITQGDFYMGLQNIGNNPLVGNLLERASSLVDGIFADEDGKFKVGLNYQQGVTTQDQRTDDRFGLTLSTQINNRILINGKVGVPVGGIQQTSVVGDVEIAFLLNESGTLQFTLFNRENNIQYIGEQLGFTQGSGLSYSVDFNTFEEFLTKILKKELNSVQETQQTLEQKNLVPDYIRFPGDENIR
ncbi:translocation/assembly module TamB domain-containing protein [Gangjinia marincola]|uniref:Translocation/assembly module TamB domain-containing protein n=1 Tax=Gangjinia marincola TaxID=578463 RepID=A0ABP3XPT0_9FLAO